ncbi:hypothetical protein ACIP9H_29310 [Streptomyces sp. NPDC088732]|uniref:hypothetical protein n=1 Tax=Streptomyces sp. NPDC088732 TaxID=3365879 RepID=UPI003823586B
MVSFPLDLRTELRIGGQWHTFGDVRTASGGDITIKRGRSNPTSQPEPVQCTAKLNNRHGDLSPDNPYSPYYGQLDEKIEMRVSVPAAARYLDLGTGGRASTPDASAIDITGDIDVRFDAQLDNWIATVPGNVVELVGKYNLTGNQRSWYLVASAAGGLRFGWSTDGTSANGFTWTTGNPLPVPSSGRLAVRVTLDVNNGTGGWTISYYTAPTLAIGNAGGWTLLESHAENAGTTSIFNSTAALEIGDITSTGLDVAFEPAQGRIYGVEIRNGINGTVVASPNFSTPAAGTGSFADAAGRTWTVTAPAAINDRDYRAHTEVSKLPVDWDDSGNDVFVPVQGSGIRQRLGQGQKALPSALARRIPGFGPLAYWALEDGADATSAYSPISGVAPMALSGVNWAANDSLPASGPLPALATGGSTLPNMRGVVPPPTGAITGWQVRWLYRLDTANTTLRTFMRILSRTGTVRERILQWRNNLTRVIALDADGNVIFQNDFTTGSDLYGQWNETRFYTQQVGGTVNWFLTFQDVGGDFGSVFGSYSGTIGAPSVICSPADGFSTDLNGMSLGHISAWRTTDVSAYIGAIIAYTGDRAGTRMLRLAGESAIPLTVRGPIGEQTRVGYQRIGTFLQLVQQAAEADGGVLDEPRHRLGLRYRGRTTMYNQTPVQVPFGKLVAGTGKPIRDDSLVRNDMTVTRIGGSSGRYVEKEGPRGVDRYTTFDSATSLSLYSDDQAAQIAAWLVHLGTTTDARYPNVTVSLRAFPDLADRLAALDVGDRLQITGIPLGKGPVGGTADLIVQGITENLSQTDWRLTFSCTPASPWDVARADDGRRANTDGTQLTAAVTATATAATVTVTDGPLWVTTARHPTEFPFGVTCEGEDVTVTACTGSRQDSFTRTASSSWGAADIGGTWTNSGGSASDFSVTGGRGRHSNASIGVSRTSVLTAPQADIDQRATVRTSALATGGSQYTGLVARFVDVNNHYYARATFTTSATVQLVIQKRVAGIQTDLATVTIPGLTHVASVDYGIRFQAFGSTLRARVWLASAVEPGSWHASVTDTAFSAAGSVGMRTILDAANTNPLPVLVDYDAYEVLNPQTQTWTRSANGIVKTHPAGADVRVTRPAIAPL